MRNSPLPYRRSQIRAKPTTPTFSRTSSPSTHSLHTTQFSAASNHHIPALRRWLLPLPHVQLRRLPMQRSGRISTSSVVSGSRIISRLSSWRHVGAYFLMSPGSVDKNSSSLRIELVLHSIRCHMHLRGLMSRRRLGWTGRIHSR